MADAIAGALACVIATVVLTLLEVSSAAAPDEAGSRVTLRHGAVWRVFAGTVTVLFTVGTALLVVEAVAKGFDTGAVVTLLLMVAFLALGLRLVREGRRSFVLDDVGIHFGAPAGTTRTIAWQNVRSVEYSAMRERIVVRDTGGRVAGISKYVRGLDRLWASLEKHVPADIWSAASVKCRGRGRGAPMRRREADPQRD